MSTVLSFLRISVGMEKPPFFLRLQTQSVNEPSDLSQRNHLPWNQLLITIKAVSCVTLVDGCCQAGVYRRVFISEVRVIKNGAACKHSPLFSFNSAYGSFARPSGRLGPKAVYELLVSRRYGNQYFLSDTKDGAELFEVKLWFLCFQSHTYKMEDISFDCHFHDGRCKRD